MTTPSVSTFFDTHEISGAMTPQQAAAFLDATSGDTGATPENAGEPTASPAQPDQAGPSSEPNEATEPETQTDSAASSGATEPEPEGADPVILAKDGKHVIAYDKLVEARAEAKTSKAEAEAAQAKLELAQRELEELRQRQAKAEPAADKTPQPQAVDLTALRKQRIEALATGNDDLALQLDEQIDAELEKRAEARVMARLSQQREQDAAQDAAARLVQVAEASKRTFPQLDNASDQANPDAIAFVIGKRDILAQQGMPMHDALQQAVESASKLFGWKSSETATSQAKTEPKPSPGAAAEVAKAAIAAAKKAPPTSLSEIPGGRVDSRTPDQVLAGKSAPDLVEALASKTPEQIEEFLNRTL